MVHLFPVSSEAERRAVNSDVGISKFSQGAS
jgi:hypothetical protein